MEKFTTLTSTVVPLPLQDVDTDLIIPAQFLTSISREGYGKNLFRRLRDSDPNFPLNHERFAGAKVLAADDNFGCGSSREAAVWALVGAGFRVVIAPSFADIFFSNSAKNGLLLVTLPQAVVSEILAAAADGSYAVTVSLEEQSVILPGGTVYNFAYDPFRKHCLLNGHDDLDYLLSKQREIEAYRERRVSERYYSTLSENNSGA